jgi:hypothetical protein
MEAAVPRLFAGNVAFGRGDVFLNRTGMVRANAKADGKQ